MKRMVSKKRLLKFILIFQFFNYSNIQILIWIKNINNRMKWISINK